MIYFSDSPSEIHYKLTCDKSRKGLLCKDTVEDHRSALRSSLTNGKPKQPIIVTGHQPIFHHPGILIKDLLAAKIAEAVGGTAIHLIVDTDEEEIDFKFPVHREKGIAGLDHIHLHKGVLYDQLLKDDVRARAIERLSLYERELTGVFSPEQVGKIREEIRSLIQIFSESKYAWQPSVLLKNRYLEQHTSSVKNVLVSDLVKTNAFSYLCDFICKRGKEFRQVHNNALHHYRIQHNIKNSAQPVPDLNDEAAELPYWILKEGKRVPLTEDNMNGGIIFPRAITLTLFTRLFLSDLFIHGLGGGRYDQITDKILIDFFGCDAARFTVASATLQVDSRADYPMIARDIGAVERDLRTLKFDPEHFLPKDHPNRLKLESLIEKRSSNGSDKKQIHLEREALRKESLSLLPEKEEKLQHELHRAIVASRNKSVFEDRTLPFFFYNLSSISEAVKAVRKELTVAAM